jgi:hypothetical protein
MDAFEEIGDEDDPHGKVTEIQIMKDYGRSFSPSSKRACLAILTRWVSTSYHRIFFIVCGM